MLRRLHRSAPRTDPMAPRPTKRPPAAASESPRPAEPDGPASATVPPVSQRSQIVAPAAANGAPMAPPEGWSREDVELLKDTVAKGCTDAELRLFMLVCAQTGLNPFARQIYMIRRWDNKLGREVATPQTSIDGFRLIADRTGQIDGSETQWCGMDGVWRDAWLSDEHPAAARTTVWRKGSSRGFSAVALFKEYAQRTREGGLTSMWAGMPVGQIGKCSESLALRKAFPAELSGLYTREEMDQAAAPPQSAGEAPPALPPPPAPRDVLQGRVIARLQTLGVTNDGRRALIELAGGPEAHSLGQLPDNALQALATGIITPEKVRKWNDMGRALREADNQPTVPAVKPEVLPPLADAADVMQDALDAGAGGAVVIPMQEEDPGDDSDDPATWALAGDEVASEGGEL